MAKLGPVQEQTMEEILASIRRMISDGDPVSTGPRPPEPRLVETGRSSGNVARLFAEEDDEPAAVGREGGAPDNVVELAMAQAMEDAEEAVRMEAAAPEAETPQAAAGFEEAAPTVVEAAGSMDGLVDVEAGPPPAQAVLDVAQDAVASRLRNAVAAPLVDLLPSAERRPPLLSPRSDAMVSSAFNQLATTMLSGSARTIDQLVEDLLRPMLRNWLDMNLPPLVERLVREEIERVSRGRR